MKRASPYRRLEAELDGLRDRARGAEREASRTHFATYHSHVQSAGLDPLRAQLLLAQALGMVVELRLVGNEIQVDVVKRDRVRVY